MRRAKVRGSSLIFLSRTAILIGTFAFVGLDSAVAEGPITLGKGEVVLSQLPKRNEAVGEEALFSVDLHLPLSKQYRVWIKPNRRSPASAAFEYLPSDWVAGDSTGLVRGGSLIKKDQGDSLNPISGTVTEWRVSISIWDGANNKPWKEYLFDYLVTWTR